MQTDRLTSENAANAGSKLYHQEILVPLHEGLQTGIQDVVKAIQASIVAMEDGSRDAPNGDALDGLVDLRCATNTLD